MPATFAAGARRQRAIVLPLRVVGSTEAFVRSQVTWRPVAGSACTVVPSEATRTRMVGDPMLPSVVPV